MKITVWNAISTLALIAVAIGVWAWGFLDRPYPALGGEAFAALAIIVYAVYAFITEAEEKYEEEHRNSIHY